MALDIGPKTVKKYVEVIGKCKSAIWNGPMGVFEMPCYSMGTFAIAKAMGEGTQKAGLLSIIGGGDSASAAELSGEAAHMSHVSTGGGASLELLEGKTLPGVAILTDKPAQSTNADSALHHAASCKCGKSCSCVPVCNCSDRAAGDLPAAQSPASGGVCLWAKMLYTALLVLIGFAIGRRFERRLLA